jgi:hypothetical protein
MTIDSPAVLLVQNDVAPGREASFDAWYLADHMPDRVATPGFRRARRWRALAGGPRDLSLYEIDGLAVMASPPYLARLAEPTEGTRRHMDAFLGMVRAACDVPKAEGFADGGFAALLPISSPVPEAGIASLLADGGWGINPDAGIVAGALLRCDDVTSHSDSVESRLRREPDRRIAAAAWIEAASAEQAAGALGAAQDVLARAGLAGGAAVVLRLVATFHRP